MQALKLDVSQYGTIPEVTSHIKSAMERDLPELAPAPFPHNGEMVIVGSGPSLINYADEIKAEQEAGKTICAIKGSHDWLCENGIEPDCFVSVEPRDRSDQVKLHNDHTVYLLASRVNPAVFDMLEDRNVILWHSWGEYDEGEHFRGKMAVGGGTTSGLRAINIGFVLGYRKFKLYGFDSCLSEDKSIKRFTGEAPGPIIDVIVGGRTFWCTYALAQQADDFQKLYEIMDITIESVGDGLISTIIEERKKMGLKT